MIVVFYQGNMSHREAIICSLLVKKNVLIDFLSSNGILLKRLMIALYGFVVV